MTSVTLSLSQTTYQKTPDAKMGSSKIKLISASHGSDILFKVVLAISLFVLAASIVFWTVGSARYMPTLETIGRIFFALSIFACAIALQRINC